MKVRLSVITAISVLGIIGLALVLKEQYTAAVGLAGIIGTGLHNLIKQEDKT